MINHIFSLLAWVLIFNAIHIYGDDDESETYEDYSGYEIFEEDDQVSDYSYDGIPACYCFHHCECFSSYLEFEFQGIHYGGFPKTDRPYHPRIPADSTWHIFLREILEAKGNGPDFIYRVYTPFDLLEDTPHLLPTYLNSIEAFKKKLAESRESAICCVEDWYGSPKDAEERKKRLDQIDQETFAANHILAGLPVKLIESYRGILASCSHANMAKFYCIGILNALEGNFEESIDDIDAYISLVQENGAHHLLDTNFYRERGESHLEVGRYHQAIEDLTKAIEKDPANKKAYFSRAVSYFETGNFDMALLDYLSSDRGKNISKSFFTASAKFTGSLFNGLCQGGCDAVVDFSACLCNTTYGCGRALWATIDHPIEAGQHAFCVCQETAQNFANSCQEMAEFCKNINWETIEGSYDNCISEVKTLCECFDQLSASERGELIGYAIGKYGTDIFASAFVGGVAVKGACALKNLKNANRLCNIESMIASTASKEAIITAATEHATGRRMCFETVKYNYDDHHKHIFGHHHYEPDRHRSIWQHNDPEGVLRRLAGGGRRVSGIPGESGYREVVDVGEHIGIWKNRDGTMALPTTKGTIHYGKKGAHIVPADPRK